ncbi:hypothetical protein ACOTWZ_09430 [Burkholderia glumae]
MALLASIASARRIAGGNADSVAAAAAPPSEVFRNRRLEELNVIGEASG